MMNRLPAKDSEADKCCNETEIGVKFTKKIYWSREGSKK
jgi:hypothetical protein